MLPLEARLAAAGAGEGAGGPNISPSRALEEAVGEAAGREKDIADDGDVVDVDAAREGGVDADCQDEAGVEALGRPEISSSRVLGTTIVGDETAGSGCTKAGAAAGSPCMVS